VFANGSGAGRIADSDGWCEFEVRDPSACLLCGEDGDFVATPVEFELAPGDRRTLDVVFQAGAALAGVVVDDVGTPVARAALSARGRRLGRVQDWSHDAVSAADGTFRIRGLAPGEFLVDVKGAEGHDQLSSVPATVPAADARFVLRRDGSVSFRLRVPSGAKPVEACFVSHVPIGHRGEISMMSRLTQATDGSFRVPASAGAWRFSVTVMGYLQIRRELDVAPGADTSLGEIVLDPGLTLEGRVVDTEGRLVADASVAQAGTFSVEGLRARREFRSKLGIELATEDTDAPGTFRFEHVAPGKLTVVASAEGYAPETVSLDVAAGSPPLVITLHRGGVLRGTIRDSVGKPITDVDVEVKVGDSPATWLTLDKSGAFSRRVLDGRARLVVRRGGTTLATREVDVREGEETSVEITLER
jgi:hypothetical protein